LQAGILLRDGKALDQWSHRHPSQARFVLQRFFGGAHRAQKGECDPAIPLFAMCFLVAWQALLSAFFFVIIAREVRFVKFWRCECEKTEKKIDILLVM
jgi:hypothetical protein